MSATKKTLKNPDEMSKRLLAIDGEAHRYPSLLCTQHMTLKQMRYFLAVVHSRKITSAARDIYISPASITEAVRCLEETLGVRLFDRKCDGMHLTREGARFRDYCEKILLLVDDALRTVKKSNQITGELRIAASPAVQGYFLPPVLSRFQCMFPGIHIHLLECERDEIEQRVLRRDTDMGILLVSNVGRQYQLHKRKLFSSTRFLWCSAAHPLAEKTSVSLLDIANEPYVQLTIDETEENTVRFWKDSGLQPKTILRTKTVEAVRGYVGQGSGITILSEMLFRPWSLEGDRLVAKPIGQPIPTMDVGAIWLRQQPSPQVTLLFDFLSFQRPTFSATRS